MTAGDIAVWGPVDQVASPYLVLPLTVEPTKPRLCHYERYFNLWIRDLPFKLELPRYVLPHYFQTTFNDKNGYQHVLLHSWSQSYFGFRWQVFYFVFRTLFLSGGRPVRLFITSLISRFQVPLGPLGSRCPNTLTTGMWVSFSLLPFG